MTSEEEAMAEAMASQVTEEWVKAAIKELGDNPMPSAVMAILKRIEAVPDNERRTLLFLTARQFLKRHFHKLVTDAQSRAAKYWNEHRAQKDGDVDVNPFQFADEEDAVRAISEKCAMVWWNGGVRYVFWDADGFPVFGNRRDAEDYYEKYQLVTYTDKGVARYTSAFALWMKARHRREYKGVGFYPDTSKAKPDFLNLWTGFAIIPATDEAESKWNLLRDHIFENICRSNQEHFDWLMDWMSQMVFEPSQKSGVIVVLRGKPGTGKTKLGEWLLKIIGWRHSIELTQEQHLTGNFNAHIENMLFILAEEAFFAADPKAGKVLKTIATSHNAVFENKGKDIRRGISCCRIMMPTNVDWAVPVEAADRRYCIYDVSDKRQNDKAYFAAIDEQMENCGAAAFLRDLLARRMTFRNMKDIPMTDAKREQIRFSLGVKDKWLASVLTDGQFPVKVDRLFDAATEWPANGGPVAKADVVARYQGFVSRPGGSPTPEELAAFLNKYFGTLVTRKLTIAGKRVPHYVLPPLSDARNAFLKITPNYEFELEADDESDTGDGGDRHGQSGEEQADENVVPLQKRRSRF